ncbi:MAG: hypothetical protein KAI79_18560 [Bacteroidales bacterium]|nr:hypothetical protein [Bacteroidales bacterium]
MVITELRFVRLLDDIDEAQETLYDLGGEENSIIDSGRAHEERAGLRMEEIEFESGIIEVSLTKIREEMELSLEQFDIMREPAITNRWELYAQMKNAKIISMKDMI